MTALWIRSLLVRDEIYLNVFGHQCIIDSFPHHVYISRLRWPPDHAPLVRVMWWGGRQIPSDLRYLELRLESQPDSVRIAIPYWLPVLPLSAIVAWPVLQSFRQSRLRRAGLCPSCGYDLRGTPLRCPECGTPVTGEPISR
jgi:hypothetical protein